MPNKVVGPLSCTQSGCHELSSSQVRADSVIQGNEFQVWLQTDGHAQAYDALNSGLARQISRNMGLGDPRSAELCLTCHAVVAPAGMQGEYYDVTDGVTCEACHGPAGQWIDTHHEIETVPIETVRAQGMYPTEDPTARAEMCLDCHIGTTDTFAGHQLLAAGHPRTGFELVSDTRLTAHYTVDEDYLDRKPVPPRAVQWAIGQAVAAERRMDLLISPRSGTIGFFPQLAFFDCHGCHQPMSVKRKASVNRRGQPKLHDAHLAMLKFALEANQPGLADRLENDRRALHAATARNRDALVQAASAARASVRDAREVMTAPGFNGPDLEVLLANMAAAGASGRYADFASSEQLFKTMNWTIIAMYEWGIIDRSRGTQLTTLLDPLFEQVETDDGYNAAAFQQAMQAFQRGLAATN